MSALEKLLQEQSRNQDYPSSQRRSFIQSPKKAGVIIKDREGKILTGYNGGWLTDKCFYPSIKNGEEQDGIKNRVIANNKYNFWLNRSIYHLDSGKVDNGSPEAQIINEYLDKLTEDEIKDLCRVCFRNSDDNSIFYS